MDTQTAVVHGAGRGGGKKLLNALSFLVRFLRTSPTQINYGWECGEWGKKKRKEGSSEKRR